MDLESARRNFKKCEDAEAAYGKFKELSLRYDKMDEQLTIIRATISSTNYWAGECEDMVVDKSMQSSQSRNYLEEMLLRKLASVEENWKEIVFRPFSES